MKPYVVTLYLLFGLQEYIFCHCVSLFFFFIVYLLYRDMQGMAGGSWLVLVWFLFFSHYNILDKYTAQGNENSEEM